MFRRSFETEELAATGSAGGVELVCKDAFGTQVADALVGHLVHRPVRSCPGKDAPRLWVRVWALKNRVQLACFHLCLKGNAMRFIMIHSK